MSHRVRCAVESAFLDAAAFVAAYFIVLAVRDAPGLASWFTGGDVGADWSLAVTLAITLVSFVTFGLYQPEIYVFRPLLVRTVVKAVLVATTISAAAVYLVKSSVVSQSRFMLLGTFGLFMVFSVVLRLAVCARTYGRQVARERPVTLLLGRSARGEVLCRRLSDLKGFSRWRHVQGCVPQEGQQGAAVSCVDGVQAAVRNLREQGRTVGAVFVDADGLPLPVVLPVVQAVRAQHITVYVVSDLVRPLHSNRVLHQLFEAPLVRVRPTPPNGAMRAAKRALDVVGASAALLVLAVPMAVMALAIKLTSPGPVLYKQRRIGLRGQEFQFLKFRSMVVNNDPERHQQVTTAFMRGEVQACDFRDEEETAPVFKILDDDRITSVGRFLRRYSLDELPQFWNVLRGDMSLVGPRPPLPYEVQQYSDWHRQRLSAVPGVSGLWQVGGRSRVTFDEMVFQDLFYQLDQSPLLDVLICLRTVPAIVNGRGAA